MPTYNKIPADKIINKTAKALQANGIIVFIAENGAEAKAKALELIPKNAEVLTMSSTTDDEIGLNTELDESGAYNSVRKALTALPKDFEPVKKLKMGAAPEWAVGSVHAVTEDGKVMVASQSGSQLPAYAAGAAHVLWVVGAQKIVKDLNEAWDRLSSYTLPLEDARAHKAYNIPEGKPGSAINKLLIINKEIRPGRITIVLVKEVLGF